MNGRAQRLARKTLLAAAAVALCAASAPALAAPLVTGLGGASGFGTVAMSRNDDGSSAQIALGSSFPFGLKLFAGTYTTLYINNNGNLTFRSPLGTYTPQPFPVTNLPMLAAFWGDVDTRGGLADVNRNNVYYSTAIPGKFIVTWNYVGYYSGKTNKLNSFQMIITDRKDVGEGDFDLEYRYEQLEWTTGDASGGSNGLGGTPAQMGYDAGDGKNFYRHPDSGTANILNLVQGSNAGEPGVWRFEVRGGKPTPVKIPTLSDVHLIETINAADIEVDMQSFQTPPTSVTTANGATRIEWAFDKFPANIAKDLAFDVMFKNPKGGERRALVTRVELSYKDVNGNLVRSELAPEFVSVLPSIYQVVPSTDKPSYGANEPVLITSLVSNLSAFPASAAVRVTVFDATGTPVAVVGTTAAQLVAAGGNLPFGGLQMSTGTLYAGQYRLLAEVLDSQGAVAASGSGGFAIAAAAGAQATANISADKREYGPYEQVRLSDRIANALNNASLDNVRLSTQVLNPDGSLRFEKSDTLAQLPPSGSRDFAYALQLGGAKPGDYVAKLALYGADGALLAQSSTQFKVASSADTGAGLSATLSASSTRVHDGQQVKLSFNALNNGNAELKDVPLTLRVVDPVSERVMASYPFTANMAIGGNYPGAADWQAVGTESGNMVAVLEASFNGKAQMLAQLPLTVLTLSYDVKAQAANNVLALVSCRDDEEVAADPACQSTRAQQVDALLTALDVPHKVVADEAAFKLDMRSGRFNTYWLSGKQDKLHDTVARELREVVFNGEGMLVDGEHDERNKVLDVVAGVRWRGKFGALDLPVELGGQLFPAGQLGSVGRAGRVDLAGGTEQAEFSAGVPHGTAPAVVSNQFGAGRAVQFAFDLPASVQAQAGWQPVVAKALQYVLRPYTGKLAPGQPVPVSFNVSNQGPLFQAQASSILPPGAAYLDGSGNPVYDADSRTLLWSFELPTHGQWQQGFRFAAPATAGSFAITSSVGTVDPASGKVQPYGAPKLLSFQVGDVARDGSDAITALNGMTTLSKQAGRTRDNIVELVRSALAGYQQGSAASLESAIGNLLDAVEQLDALPVDTRAIHDGLNRLTRECQRRWSLQQ